jgi:hypothetical protein
MRRQYSGQTWIDLGFGAGRRGLVRCPDGRLRRARLGDSDTFFSIKACVSAYGKTVTGAVYAEDEFTFSPDKWRKNADIFTPNK